MAGTFDDSSADATGGGRSADGLSAARSQLQQALRSFHRTATDNDILEAGAIIRSGEFHAAHAAFVEAVREFAKTLRRARSTPEHVVIAATAVVGEAHLQPSRLRRRVIENVVRHAVDAYYDADPPYRAD